MHFNNMALSKKALPDHALKHIGFKSFTPPPCLAPWIQCFWVAHHPQLPTTGFIENLYPDGGSNINFYFHDNQLPIVEFSAVQTFSTMNFSGAIDVMGIRFHPGGAHRLLGLEMPELTGTTQTLGSLQLQTHKDIRLLIDRLADIKNPALRLKLVEQWLLKQARFLALEIGPVQNILSTSGLLSNQTSIGLLTQKIGFSQRQLERYFKKEVGITVANLKQLQFVKHARLLISAYPQTPLVTIAQEAGFYDQAHFNRLFKKFTQQTPGQYRKRKRIQAKLVNS